jgi:serine/threonine-protein kinase SRPK3
LALVCAYHSYIPFSSYFERLLGINKASWKDKHLTEWIQPLSLRAPEVFLGATWDASVDLWGFACVVSLPVTFTGLTH